VFGHHHGIARVDQPVQLTVEQIYIRGVEPRGRLVQEVEGMPSAGSLKFGGELDPLRLTT